VRTLLLTLAALALLATVAHADGAPSPWFSEARGSALKTIDLDSIGTGLSLNVYRVNPTRSIWADGCLLYDSSSNVVGGFGGVSTEPKGLPFADTFKAVFATVGVGVKLLKDDLTWAAYGTIHF